MTLYRGPRPAELKWFERDEEHITARIETRSAAKPKPDDKMRLAHHEAAHGCYRIANGGDIIKITIIPEVTNRGWMVAHCLARGEFEELYPRLVCSLVGEASD
jgi:hypothetical protein